MGCTQSSEQEQQGMENTPVEVKPVVAEAEAVVEKNEKEADVVVAAADAPVEVVAPRSIRGSLLKKSPNSLAGWQQRFCKLDKEGHFAYYGSVSLHFSLLSSSFIHFLFRHLLGS